MAGFAGEYNTGFDVYDGAIVVITGQGDEVKIDCPSMDDMVEALRQAGREGHPGDMAEVFGVNDLKGERMSAVDAALLVEHLLHEEAEEAAYEDEGEDMEEGGYEDEE